MWLFTTRGMFSVVRVPDTDEMQIRARRRSHLENLRAIGLKAKILETPDGDYGFRCVVSRAQWECVAAVLAREVDYPNFKNAATKCGAAYARALHDVWARMSELQP